MAGRKHKVAAQKPAVKVADNQEVACSQVPENNSGNGDATAGELAAIGRAEAAEHQLCRIVDFLATGPDGYRPIEGELPVDVVIRIIKNQAEAIASTLAAIERAEAAERQIALIDDILESGEIVRMEGEGAVDAAVRLIHSFGAQSDADGHLLSFLLSIDGFTLNGDENSAEAAIRVIKDLQGSAEAEPEPADPARAEYALAVEGEVATYAGLIAAIGDDAPLAIRFGDGEVFVGAPISVGAEDLKPLGRQAVYERRISFPVDSPSGRVTAAWLVGGDHAVRCDIPSGLRVGGGAQASVPAGHLIF